MANSTKTTHATAQGSEFLIFTGTRIVGGLVIAAALIWVFMKIIGFINPDTSGHPSEIIHSFESNDTGTPSETSAYDTQAALAEKSSSNATPHESETAAAPNLHSAPAQSVPAGTALVEALMAPIRYELEERFWGWRPNDVIQFTDNVNEFQLGVLEVTRRAATRLTENISRTGSTATINKHLERAMNSFMIRADSFMIPSAESSYAEAIENLERYKEQLIRNEATFYNRPDNLIPLLQALEELLGSCDENLVKKTLDNGDPVSTFMADNYYYYAKGVASAMLPILYAIQTDFSKVLEVRNSDEVLHHAIEACHHASEMKPWLFVTESNPNGIFANHRANMASAISHARFYMGLLVVSLST